MAAEGDQASSSSSMASEITSEELAELKKAIFAPNLEPNDIQRWYSEKIDLCELDGLKFGLVQRAGGPCGVLASLQAFVIRELLIQERDKEDQGSSSSADPAATGGGSSEVDTGQQSAGTYPQNLLEVEGTTVCGLPVEIAQVSRETIEEVLAKAVSLMLWQCIRGVVITPMSKQDHTFNVEIRPSVPEHSNPVYLVEAECDSFSVDTEAKMFRKTPFYRFDNLRQHCRQQLNALMEPGGKQNVDASLSWYESFGELDAGIMLLMMSLVVSRGISTIQADMDEAASLVQHFGHSSQELLNLCLTGKATSNVHDGSKSLAPELQDVRLEGIQSTPLVGYLSHLEALRYFEVGTFYKEPASPVWVVASQSHFTVLFGTSDDMIQASQSSILRRTFEKYDPHLSGFVQTDKLKDLLTDLGLHATVSDQTKFEKCKSKLDSEGIVVWQQLWSLVNPIIQGNAEESTLWSNGETEEPLVDSSMDENTLASVARSIFDRFDVHGGQFVEAEKVPQLLRELKIELSEDTIQQLTQQITAQAGVALWDFFWPAVAPHVMQFAKRTEKKAKETSPVTGSEGTKNRRLDMYHYNGLTNSTQNPTGSHLAVLQSKEDTANIHEQMEDVDMALQMSMAQPEDQEMDESARQQKDPPDSPPLGKAKSGNSPLEAVLSTKWKGCWVGRMDDLHRTACGMKSNTTQVPDKVDRKLLWRYSLQIIETVPSID